MIYTALDKVYIPLPKALSRHVLMKQILIQAPSPFVQRSLHCPAIDTSGSESAKGGAHSITTQWCPLGGGGRDLPLQLNDILQVCCNLTR